MAVYYVLRRLVRAKDIIYDRELTSGTVRGLACYWFGYHYTGDDGKLVHGEYDCVENSDCIVYMWILWRDDCSRQVHNELFDILESLDLAM